jgi:hypothetical protein
LCPGGVPSGAPTTIMSAVIIRDGWGSIAVKLDQCISERGSVGALPESGGRWLGSFWKIQKV